MPSATIRTVRRRRALREPLLQVDPETARSSAQKISRPRQAPAQARQEGQSKMSQIPSECSQGFGLKCIFGTVPLSARPPEIISNLSADFQVFCFSRRSDLLP